MSYYFVKTVINSLCRAVKVYEDEVLTISKFVERALTAHELDASEISSLEFTVKDSDNMPIEDMAMISQWKTDSSFKVIIDLKVSRKKVEIVAESLSNFIKKQKVEHIVDEQNILHYLTPQSRRKLIKVLVLFIRSEYSQPTQENINTVCQATISLFNSLKVENSSIGGIDLLYDSARSTGHLYNALNYDSKKKRKAMKSVEDLLDDDKAFTDEEKDDMMKFFKRCVLPKDRKAVETKMKETKIVRRQVILDDFQKYQECWQFYFVSPELILLDFKLMFENTKESGLMDKWALMKDVPYKQFGIRIEKNEYPVMRKDDDIFKMFMFLKLLPTPRCSFDKAVKNFLIYTEDSNEDPMNMRNTKLKNPYIIAIFSLVSGKVAYYIDIQDGLFPLPSEFSFVEVVDILVKIHHVFNFEYAKEFSKLMYFFEYTAYEIPQAKRFMTPRMLEVASAIMQTKPPDDNNND